MPFRRAYFLVPLLPLLSAGLFSCADLPVIEENRCGNGFIEPGEDCDDFGATAKKNTTPGAAATCNAPGVPDQCRFHCAGDSQCQAAPVSAKGSGWRCGVDKVCRRPQGDDSGNGTFFTPATSLFSGAAAELFTGDFDGDGRKDLLAVGPAGFDVDYFTRGGALAKSLRVPGAPIVPAIGKLTSTTADDFTIDVAQGIGVMLGGVGQTIDPTSYASLDVQKRYQTKENGQAPDDMRLLIVDTGATVPDLDNPGKMLRLGAGPMALSVNPGVLTLIDASADPKDGASVPVGAFTTKGSASIVGTIPVAFVAGGDGRQRFFLALRDEPSLYVVDPGGPVKANIKSQLDLPAGFTVHGAALVGDANGDGMLDILVGAADCSQGPMKCTHAEIEVAYGYGMGKFTGGLKMDNTPDPVADGKMLPYVDVFPGGETHPNPKTELGVVEIDRYLPLALGKFLLNDGSLGYVNAFGIFVKNAGGFAGCALAPNGYCQADRPSGGQLWSEVKVADFNANGRLDVAAVSRGNAGIDFFNGTGGGVFNSFSIPTEGVPGDLAVGDFDGDFLPDLAFDSVTSGPAGEAHSLSVAFGHSSGAPELPVSMGEVTNLRQIVAGNMSLFGNDAATDIVLLTGVPARIEDKAKKPGKDWKVGLAQGNGYRQLQAPLIFFARKTINVDATPLASAIGLFDSDGGSTGPGPHADVAAVVQSFKPRPMKPTTQSENAPFCQLQASLWMLPALGDAVIEPPADDSQSILISTGDAAVPDNFLPLRRLVETVPIQVDGEAKQSLLITFPTYDACDPDIASIGAHGELLLARFDTTGTPHLTQLIKTVGPNEFLIRPRVGDLDGDGILDIAALKVSFDLDFGKLSSSQIVVLHGGLKGTFGPPLVVPVGGVPVDLALVNADGDSGLELVVVSAPATPTDITAGLSVIGWDKLPAHAASPFTTLLPRSNPSAGDVSSAASVLDRPTALAGGDFDGDGVDDVAVAIAGGIRMYKGVAK